MSTTPTSTNPTGLQNRVQLALNGMQTVFPAGSTLSMKTGVMTQAQVVAQLSGYLPLFQAVVTQKAAYKAAVTARSTMQPDCRTFISELRNGLIALLGKNSPLLEQFGMSDKKAPQKTSTENAVAAAKRQLTRTTLGTLGKQQKKQKLAAASVPVITITGQGVSVAPAQSTAPAAAAPQTESTSSPASTIAPATSAIVVPAKP